MRISAGGAVRRQIKDDFVSLAFRKKCEKRDVEDKNG